MSDIRYFASSGEPRRFAVAMPSVHSVIKLAISPMRLQAMAKHPEQLLSLAVDSERNHIELHSLSSDQSPLLVPQHWLQPAILVLSGSVRVETQARGGTHTSLVYAASIVQLSHAHRGLPTRSLIQADSRHAQVALLGFRPSQLIDW